MKPLTPESWIRKLAIAEEESRIKAANYFARFPVEQQKQAVYKHLASSDSRIRRATYVLIGELKDANYHEELVNGLHDKNNSVLQMAIWAVGRCRVLKAIPIMHQLIKQGVGFKISKTIIWAWGEMRDRSVLPMLIDMIEGASARQLEGILVTGIKLGEKSFYAILQRLDPNDLSVQKALADVTKASRHARNMMINATHRQAIPIAKILPWVSFTGEEYTTLLQIPQENIRLACYQSLHKSSLPLIQKRSFFVTALQDESNRIVQLAIQALSSQINNPHVDKQLRLIAIQHPSPKIRSLITAIWEKEEIHRRFITQAVEASEVYLLQTLPGLERFVIEECHAMGLSLKVEKTDNGWLAVHYDKYELRTWEVLKQLHTVSQIAVVVSKNGLWNPPLDPRLISDVGSILLEITCKNMKYLAITLATEEEMQRPQRHMRGTSLDWRVARAITLLTKPTATDIFVDPTCGSGTILLSRADMGPYQQLWGNDLDPRAIQLARKNLRNYPHVHFHNSFAEQLPLENSNVDVLAANLPFGRRVGNHEANLQLYPLLLQETVRILRSGGRAVFLTQEVKLLKRSLRSFESKLKLMEEYAIAMGGLNPHLIMIHKP